MKNVASGFISFPSSMQVAETRKEKRKGKKEKMRLAIEGLIGRKRGFRQPP
jgi:hypothetical protein